MAWRATVGSGCSCALRGISSRRPTLAIRRVAAFHRIIVVSPWLRCRRISLFDTEPRSRQKSHGSSLHGREHASSAAYLDSCLAISTGIRKRHQNTRSRSLDTMSANMLTSSAWLALTGFGVDDSAPLERGGNARKTRAAPHSSRQPTPDARSLEAVTVPVESSTYSAKHLPTAVAEREISCDPRQ